MRSVTHGSLTCVSKCVTGSSGPCPAQPSEGSQSCAWSLSSPQGLQRKLGFLSLVAVNDVQVGWLKLLYEDAMNTCFYVALASLFGRALNGASILT